MAYSTHEVKLDRNRGDVLKKSGNFVVIRTRPFDLSVFTEISISGLSLSSGDKSSVWIQTKNAANHTLTAPDNFAVLVTEVATEFIRFNVRRVDRLQDPANLYLFDILIL